MNDSPWLKTDEAAKYLDMHPDTVRELFRRTELRSIKVGRTWRTRREWCDDLLLGGGAA